MEESNAIGLLIQSVHKAQARGTFELMESYTLAAAVDVAAKLQERLRGAEEARAKQQIIDEAKKEAEGGEEEKKVGHEAPGSPELLKEIPLDNKKKEEKKDK